MAAAKVAGKLKFAENALVDEITGKGFIGILVMMFGGN